MSFFPPEPERQAPVEPEMVDRWDPANGNFPGVLGVPVSIPVPPLRAHRLAITMDQFRVFPEGFNADVSVIVGRDTLSTAAGCIPIGPWGQAG